LVVNYSGERRRDSEVFNDEIFNAHREALSEIIDNDPYFGNLLTKVQHEYENKFMQCQKLM
jgi:hypothetical protein